MSDSLTKPRLKSKPSTKNTDSFPPALILAGGLGTRLRAAYAAGPKSMAPIAGRPFLDYLLRWLRSAGVQEVILCVGYKRSHIQRCVGKGRKWGLRVTYSIEKELLGTGGAVKKAARLIRGKTVFVVNGDTFVNVDLKTMARFHRNRRALATLAVVKVPDHGRYGSLYLNTNGRVTAFLEKVERDPRSKEVRMQPINAGVYVLEKRLLNNIGARRPMSLEKNVFPELIATKKVYGLLKNAYFIDIGVPEDLRRAQIELPKQFIAYDPR